MSEDAFQTQLDLVNQTTLIKILAQTIKENERLSLANQDSSNAPGNHLQSISHQIEVQKQRLEALRRSNEEIILETENTKKLFQKKIQSVQQNYETLLQEKLDLTIQKTEKIQSYKAEIESLEIEERDLDQEIAQLKDQINQINPKNYVTRANGTWSSNAQRIINEAQNLLRNSEPMAACYENHVKFQERLFCRDPNNPNAIPTPFVTGDNQISTAPSFIKPSEDNDQIVQTTTPDGQSIYTYKQKLQAYQAQQEQQQAQQRAQAQQLAQQAAHEAETKPQQQIQQEIQQLQKQTVQQHTAQMQVRQQAALRQMAHYSYGMQQQQQQQQHEQQSQAQQISSQQQMQYAQSNDQMQMQYAQYLYNPNYQMQMYAPMQQYNPRTIPNQQAAPMLQNPPPQQQQQQTQQPKKQVVKRIVAPRK